MKVMHINYAGDFDVAYQRLFVEDGIENYYGQKYSVGIVIDGARRGCVTKVLSLVGRKHSASLEHNLDSVGLGFENHRLDYKKIQKEVIDFAPDKVVLRIPDHRILKFLRRNCIDTLPVFADSFEGAVGPRGKLYRWFLAREINNRSVQWVANHQIDASKSLKNLGVRGDKILPYDWEHPSSPEDWKKTPAEDIESKVLRVFYAGALSKQKGVFELIESLAHLKKHGRSAQLRIAGTGDLQSLQGIAARHEVSDAIQFLGGLDHQLVLTEMNSADFVVVPSRHEYPEGLPMTIMESLMVHTPVIVSDHPMFVGRLARCAAITTFSSPSPGSLAAKMMSLTESYKDYSACVVSAPHDWRALTLDLKWGAVIDAWLAGVDTTEFRGKALSDYELESRL